MTQTKENVDILEKIIHSIISKYNFKDKEDLYQVARIGILKAKQNYNPGMNSSFTSYAYIYIVGEVKKYIRENKLFKINRQYNSLYISINKARNVLAQKLNKEPSNLEIATFLNISPTLVEEASKINNVTESLDVETINMYDMIASKEDNVDLETKILLKDKIAALSSEDKNIIISRYYKDVTQGEIAQELGISQVKVYRKEKKILADLKKNW